MPHLPPDSSDPTQDERNDQRTTRETESDWLRQPGESDRHGAESNPKDEADEERNEMRLVQFLDRITECVGRLVEIFFPSDERDHVAELKAKPCYGRHLYVDPSYAGDCHTETIAETQFADGFSENVALGYDHALKCDVALREHQVFVAPFSDDTFEPLQSRRGADDHEPTISLNDSCVRGRDRFLAITDARDGDVRFDAAGNGANSKTVKIRVGHDQSAAFEWRDIYSILCRKILGFALRIDAEDLLQEDQCPDNADDRGWVAHGVGECGQGKAIGRHTRQCTECLSGCA